MLPRLLGHFGSTCSPTRNDTCSRKGSRQESRQFELVAADEKTDLCPDELKESLFLNQLAKHIFLLGVSTWASMPISLVMMWFGLSVACYIFVVLKWCLLSALQVVLRWQIKHAMRSQTLRPFPRKEPIHKSDSGRWPCISSMWRFLLCVLTFMVSVATWFLRALEAIDPDTDAMTPGTLHQSPSITGLEVLPDSWSRMPFIGSSIGQVQMPQILTSTLIVIACWQIYTFVNIWGRLAEKFHDAEAVKRRSDMFSLLFHLSDTSNLFIVSAQLKHLWLSLGYNSHGDRYHSYRNRVPEILCQGWFTVSVLSVLVDKDLEKVPEVLFSVVTSLVASGVSLYEMLSIFPAWSASMCALKRRRIHVLKLAGVIIVHMSGCTIIGIRLAAVWLCKQRRFNFDTLTCQGGVVSEFPWQDVRRAMFGS